jgi:hypothetical protein
MNRKLLNPCLNKVHFRRNVCCIRIFYSAARLFVFLHKKTMMSINLDWKRLYKSKSTLILLSKLAILYFIFSSVWRLGSRKTRKVWVFQDDYWNTKMMEYVEVGDMVEVPFNSTDFTTRYANQLGITEIPTRYISMSGSMVTIPKNKHDYAYIHIFRVSEIPCDDPYKPDGTYKGYCFQKPIRSLVFAQILDEKFRSIPGDYKGLSYPTVYDIYTPDVNQYPGPEDSRAIMDPWDNVILSFNMADKDDNKRRSQWNFNVTSGSTRVNNIYMGDKQKNWTPFFRKQRLLQVYSWNPIKVLDCRVKFQECVFVEPHQQLPPPNSEVVGNFRSGSALYQYRGFYVATTRTHRDCNGRVYRPHVTILSPELEPIYVSENIDFDGKLFISPFWSFPNLKAIPQTGYHTRILTSLTLTPSYTGKEWIAEFNINDQKNILVVLKNFEMFLDSIIYKYQQRAKDPTFLVPQVIKEKDNQSIDLCLLSK